MGLGNLLGKLLGAGAAKQEPSAQPVEYEGYSIIATPISENGQYRTDGTIQRQKDGVVQESRFIRADNNTDRQAAIDHSIRKAQQIIDEQGDALFGRENV